MKISLLLIFAFIGGALLGASFLPWQKSYGLWMPQIAGDNRSVFADDRLQKLPFDTPAIAFGITPMFLKAPFSPQEALAYRMPYFYDSGKLNDSMLVLRIDSALKIRAPTLSSPAFPRSLVAIKTTTDIFMMADWPKDFPAEDRDSLTQAVRNLLKDSNAGEYQVSLLRE